MKFKTLTLTQTESGLFEVRAEGHIADSLCVDEALGCIASALYRPDEMPQFMQSHLSFAIWQREWCGEMTDEAKAILIGAGEPLERQRQ